MVHALHNISLLMGIQNGAFFRVFGDSFLQRHDEPSDDLKFDVPFVFAFPSFNSSIKAIDRFETLEDLKPYDAVSLLVQSTELVAP